MINHSEITDFETNRIPMNRDKVFELISGLEYSDGKVTNVALQNFGRPIRYEDSFTNLLADIGAGYHFQIHVEDKPVLDVKGEYFRSILVFCPHCSDMTEYDAVDAEGLINNTDTCRSCGYSYRIAEITGE